MECVSSSKSGDVMNASVLFSKSRRRGFTLVEIMIVVLIIGLLLAIAVPNFNRAREVSNRKACSANLRRINFAKNSYIMANNKAPNTSASEFTDTVLYGSGGYLQSKPQCPGGGTYTVNDGGVVPTCDYSGGNVHIYDE